jgi:AhpD family alkylhydroperoxidase
MRIALIEESQRPDLAPLIGKIKSERGRFLNLYRVLAHAPGVCEGWLHLFTEIRQRAKLDARTRELAILLVAVINGADYEYQSHVPFALQAGMTQAQLDDLPRWQDSPLFSERERAVLAYTDAMTRHVHVPDAVFAQIRPHVDDRELVELTTTIGGYNLVSRVLEALQIPREAEHKPKA